MAEVDSIAVHFMNELSEHIEADRFLYSQGVMAKVDKVVALVLFLMGAFSVTTVGIRW